MGTMKPKKKKSGGRTIFTQCPKCKGVVRITTLPSVVEENTFVIGAELCANCR